MFGFQATGRLYDILYTFFVKRIERKKNPSQCILLIQIV